MNLDDPRSQMLMAMGLGLLGGKSANFGKNLSQAGLLGLSAYNQGTTRKAKLLEEDQQRKMREMQMAELERAQKFNQAAFSPGIGAMPNTPVDDNGYRMPSPEPQFNFGAAAAIDPYKALQLRQSLTKQEAPISVKKDEVLLDQRTRQPIFRNEAPKEVWGPVSPQDIQQFRLPQNGQGFQKSSVTNQIRAVGSVPQQVNVNAQLPASETAQAEFMKGTRATYDALKQAPATIRNMQKMRDLIPGAMQYMGPGGENFLVAAKALRKGGINIDPDAIKSAEQLRSRLAFGVIENLKKMDSQPSERQQEFLANAQGTLATDPSALPGILDAWEEMLREKVSIHNAEVNSAVGRGVKFPYDPTIALPEKNKAQGVSISGATVTLSDGRSIPFPSEAAAKAYAAEAKKRGW